MEVDKKEKMFQEWSLAVLGKAGESFPEYVNAKGVYEVAFASCSQRIKARTARKYLRIPPKSWCESHRTQLGVQKLEENIGKLYAGCLYSRQLKLACEALNLRVQGWELDAADKEAIEEAYSLECKEDMIRYLALVLWKTL